MNQHYSGQEVIPLSKDKVWAFITNPKNIAGCLPDVIETDYTGDNTFTSVVGIAVGPVRGKFKFNITLDPKPDGNSMGLRINGGGFGSVVDLTASADVKDDGSGTTTLDWAGDAEMRGPIATVGGRVLDAQANRVISTTFGNIKSQLTGTSVA
jgi:carbon monoxide dehydrogenase subunit G